MGTLLLTYTSKCGGQVGAPPNYGALPALRRQITASNRKASHNGAS